MPGGKAKRKSKCPGCHTAHSQHYFGPPGPQCSGEQESEQDGEDIQGAMADPPHKSPKTTAKTEDISALLSAVRSLSDQVHDLALDNKAIKDQLAQQQITEPKVNPTSPAPKDASIPVSNNLAAAAQDRSRTKLVEAIT